MDSLKIYTPGDISALINLRDGETKIGENVATIGSLADLPSLQASYVLLGIPEDIGVRANLGMAGAATAWKPALTAFLNMQSNNFLNGSEVAILGEFEIAEPADPTLQALRTKVNAIDALVYPVIQKIAAAGKIPIVIGGGHNNATPIILGMKMGLGKLISAVNIDAHADLRDPSEGRHSGNGFSSAFSHGFLNEYHVFGLQESYNNQFTLDYMAFNPMIKKWYFDAGFKSYASIPEEWEKFTASVASPCGLEIDMDSIENTLSSATTPSGFNLNDIRKMVTRSARKFAWLHVAEGAVRMADGRENQLTAKAIAYLISDFIKAPSQPDVNFC